MSSPQVSFTIGSVDSFERNLEQAQRDMNLPMDEYIPVLYRAESNMTFVSFECIFVTILIYDVQGSAAWHCPEHSDVGRANLLFAAPDFWNECAWWEGSSCDDAACCVF